jgi:hypothetical protein
MATSRLRTTGNVISALAQRPGTLAVLRSIAQAEGRDGPPERRHPLAPAAVRVERSHLRTDGAKADQTALTVWLGNGPNLPGPTLQGSSARFVVRTAAVLVGAVALGAMGAIAAHREAERLRGVTPVARIEG